MLLAIDIGNSNITLGVFEGETIIGQFRMRTKTQKTSDEYGLSMVGLLRERKIAIEAIEGVIIVSVVPNIMYSFVNAVRKYFDCEPMIVEPGLKTGIAIHTDNPKEVGADRIVDAVAAIHYYGGAVLVIDFGTATTYDVITAEGVFEAGITAPGIRISADALWQQAAKLPDVPIAKPDSILAKNTVTSMQAGLVYGQIGQLEYIVNKTQEEMGIPLKVIATGGLARVLIGGTECIDIYDPDLTIKGLYLIYQKNCQTGKG